MDSRPNSNSKAPQYCQNEINVKIEELDNNFRIPFQMNSSGNNYMEIARKLNLNSETVKSRISLP